MLILYEIKSAGDELQKIICFLIESQMGTATSVELYQML
jgi:hypothetical protein